MSEALRAGASPTRYDRERAARILVPQAEAELFVPAEVGDYTDFYASVHHATNVGSLFRPDNPLLPNYKWVPIGYHGRASSIVASGTPVRRPVGQVKGPTDERPSVVPTRSLDYEMEVGMFVGPGNPLGAAIPLDRAELHLFGFCLVNDWSARDVQSWEYQPLGPFLSKNFGSTLSPWVVTMEALEPFRAPFTRPEGDPRPLPYLDSIANRERGAIAIRFEVLLQTEAMREQGLAPHKLTESNFRDAYWTVAQMLTPHASNGCNLRPGDLLASGTVSGPDAEARGCLLERTWRGEQPLTLPTGELRTFLEDGDEVVMRAVARNGARLGEVRGTIAPAISDE